MSDNVGIRLAQNLREDLIVDLLAGEQIKSNIKQIKEEDLKRKYKHWWVVQLCNFLKFASNVDENNREKIMEECGKNMSNATIEILPEFRRGNYQNIVIDMIRNNLVEFDLNILEADLH